MKHDQGNLLVVDDNQLNRNLLVRRVKRQGHMTSSASDGFQALEMVRNKSFDLVLLDIMMPQMNGYQVLEVIKTDSGLRHIPITPASTAPVLTPMRICKVFFSL